MPIWLKGLISAFIGGIINSIAVMYVDPDNFNFNELGKVGIIAIISGVVGAAFYLKQSPIIIDREIEKF
jgi:hypothetical protein